jgi:hypothetical protein
MYYEVVAKKGVSRCAAVRQSFLTTAQVSSLIWKCTFMHLLLSIVGWDFPAPTRGYHQLIYRCFKRHGFLVLGAG